MSRLLDKIFALLKWPAAIVSVLLLPSAALALIGLMLECISSPVLMGAFFGGASLYMIVWFVIIRRTRASIISTFEHELTHCIFAWLTLHRVTDFKATWSKGGHMNYETEQDNWLVTVSPYFFPTAPLILLLCFWFFSDSGIATHNFLLGISFAYHLTSTHTETGVHQTDLQRVGFIFAIMLLPTANIVFSGAVIAFACGGSAAVAAFIGGVLP